MNSRLFARLVIATAIAGMLSSGSLRADDKGDPTGTWIWSRELEGQTNRSVLKLSNKDGKLTGTYRRSGQTVPISNGKFEKERSRSKPRENSTNKRSAPSSTVS